MAKRQRTNAPRTVRRSKTMSGKEWEVEKVAGIRTRGNTKEYLIKWVGYNKKNWVPAEDCHCPSLVQDYLNSKTKKSTTKPQKTRKSSEKRRSKSTSKKSKKNSKSTEAILKATSQRRLTRSQAAALKAK